MIVALSGLCVLVNGLQTVLALVQSVPYPPPPLQKKVYPAPHPPLPAKKKGQRVACASAETVQCLHSQIHRLKSWGERPFIFRAGPHYPHGPYFYCAEKPRSDNEISVVC